LIHRKVNIIDLPGIDDEPLSEEAFSLLCSNQKSDGKNQKGQKVQKPIAKNQ
jgi:hypothetical protein